MPNRSLASFSISFVALALLIMTLPAPASAIEVWIKNDLTHRDAANILYIHNARCIESPKTRIHGKVKPGNRVIVTKGNTKTFTIIRPFNRFKMKYDIQCDAEATGRVTFKIMNFYDRDLGSDCWMTRVGHIAKRGGAKWTYYNRDGSIAENPKEKKRESESIRLSASNR